MRNGGIAEKVVLQQFKNCWIFIVFLKSGHVTFYTVELGEFVPGSSPDETLAALKFMTDNKRE
jgi:hypothetical protein